MATTISDDQKTALNTWALSQPALKTPLLGNPNIGDVIQDLQASDASDLSAADLASVVNGKGASLIGLEDAAGLVTGATVEAAIAVDLAKGNGLTALAPVRRVRAETSANIASFASVSTTLDGLTLVAGDRILVRAQSTGAENGIYVVGAVGGGNAPWTRAADMAAAAVIPAGTIVAVDAGTLGAGKVRKLTNVGTITIATTALTFDKMVVASGLRRVATVVGAEAAVAANAIEVACTITDEDGVTVAAAVQVEVRSVPTTANKGAIAAAGTPVGTLQSVQNPLTGDNIAHFVTTSGGLFSFRVTNDQVETNGVVIAVDGGLPRVLKLTFA